MPDPWVSDFWIGIQLSGFCPIWFPSIFEFSRRYLGIWSAWGDYCSPPDYCRNFPIADFILASEVKWSKRLIDITMIDSKPTTNRNPNSGRRSLEWLLSILGALNCILVAAVFTNSQLTGVGLTGIWPLPLIYFVEISVLGIVCLIAVAMLRNNSVSRWSGIPWICSGILLALVILGAWTIGFYLIPAMILFLIVGILVDKRTQGDIALHLIYYVSAGIVQASLVFLTLLG